MTHFRLLALAAFAASPFAFAAQDNPPLMDPACPDVPAATVYYQSAFEGYHSFAESQETPEQVWRAANVEMGGLGGHGGHIKDQSDAPATNAVPAQVPHTAPPVPKAPSSGHASHEGIKH